MDILSRCIQGKDGDGGDGDDGDDGDGDGGDDGDGDGEDHKTDGYWGFSFHPMRHSTLSISTVVARCSS